MEWNIIFCTKIYWNKIIFEFLEVVRTPSILNIFIWKCISSYNGMYFFNIRTSKNGPNPDIFNIFFSKYTSRYNGVYFFEILISKIIRNWYIFYIMISKCILRHNGILVFDTVTFKNGPNLMGFIYFNF